MRNKGKKFEWSETAQAAFEKVKREMLKAPVLGMSTEKCMYVLDTDASVVAITLILHEKQELNGITFLSPNACGTERNMVHRKQKHLQYSHSWISTAFTWGALPLSYAWTT